MVMNDGNVATQAQLSPEGFEGANQAPTVHLSVSRLEKRGDVRERSRMIKKPLPDWEKH